VAILTILILPIHGHRELSTFQYLLQFLQCFEIFLVEVLEVSEVKFIPVCVRMYVCVFCEWVCFSNFFLRKYIIDVYKSH
jgi:hypothetical protein